MRYIVLPQAFRRVVPPLMNDFVSLQKDVALVSLIGPVEILRQADVDKATFQLHPVRGRRDDLPQRVRSPDPAADYLARQRARTGATASA